MRRQPPADPSGPYGYDQYGRPTTPDPRPHPSEEPHPTSPDPQGYIPEQPYSGDPRGVCIGGGVFR